MQRLVVVGHGPVAEALAPMAELLGWTTTVVAAAELPEVEAVVVTSHDVEVAGAALQEALARDLAYIGGMGSKKTQTARREWLLAHGVAESELDRVHGPAGLDIGADGPAEIALSILAELTAVLRGRTSVGSIKDRGGPIHPELGPGEAFCPTG
ncbi:MAG TPA: XdhC family protein [Nocardioidaceae bacterium]|nr:XdhC family protein [Nocardioidaceae bacterium]